MGADLVHATLKPAVTVIIPTYRRPRMLRRAIRSVLAQTYPRFKVCVYDDASGDDTASIVAQIAETDARVNYYGHSKNIGWLKVFNFAMERVVTPFFSFLCDDDMLLPNFLETVMRGFKEHPEIGFSCTAAIDMDHQGRVMSIPVLIWRPGFYRPPEGLLAMMKAGIPNISGIIFRREVHEVIGLLDQQVGVPADLDFELRVAAHFPFVVSRQPGVIIFRHPASISTASGFGVYWPGWLKMIQNLRGNQEISSQVRQLCEDTLSKQLQRHLYWVGRRSILNQNWQDNLQAAEVLHREYHQKWRPFLLSSIAKSCRFFPPVRHTLLAAAVLKRFAGRLKTMRLQKEFGFYSRFLSLE